MRRRVLPLALALLVSCGGARNPTVPTADPFAAEPAPLVDCGKPLRIPSAGTEHLSRGQAGRYNSDPPTSGPHWSAPDGPVAAGIYDRPIANEAQVHNLEHGHVVIQYRSLSREQVDLLRAAILGDPIQMVLAPRPTLGGGAHVALTAWTVLQTCAGFPRDAGATVRAFVDEFRNHAPESLA